MASAPITHEPLADVREQLVADMLTARQRELVTDQASLLLDGFHAHRWQKRALYGVEPLQRLRVLRRRAATIPDAEFHAQLREVFADLQDLHTVYTLPMSYYAVATLGFLVERCFDGGEPRDVVAHVSRTLLGQRSRISVGAELTHWNGAPIDAAVARYAEREAGSNAAARLARGLESMTQRVLPLSPMPDENWVELRFTVDGTVHESRAPWRVVDFSEAVKPDDDEAAPQATAPTRALAVDRRTDVIQKVKKELFAGGDEALTAEEIPTTSTVLRARRITTPHGRFGHLRIYAFGEFDGFVDEVARLLDLMPRDGLVVDVRGNPGGFILAAEGVLQLLTPHRIEPEPFQFLSSPQAARFCREVPEWFGGWGQSIEKALELGAQYSDALPISPPRDVNDRGQCYHGPVVLVTDALSYSAADIFSAGFQDHGIGPVLGVDEATGAGGATVLQQAQLLNSWPGSPFEPLPSGCGFSVAVARCLRVGPRAGRPLEDLGVEPDELYRMSRRDLLEHNVDLLVRAGELLAGQARRRLDVTARAQAGAMALVVVTENLTSVDVYVDGRPVHTAPVDDGRNQMKIPVADPRGARIRIEGFDGDRLVAARDLPGHRKA
jgi:C-terminal processing protease CtpA/Prc